MSSDDSFRPATLLLKGDETGVARRDDGDGHIAGKLKRLVALQGSDPGFYLLAVHSFVESFLRDRYALYSERESFPDLLYYFRSELEAQSSDIPLIKILGEMARCQHLANKVRHEFLRLDPEEAVATTYRIATFCRYLDLPCKDVIVDLEKSLALWHERSNRWSEMQELKKASYEIIRERKENQKLSIDLEELQTVSKRYESVRKVKLQLELDIEELKNVKEESRTKIDSLRKRRFQIEEEKRALATKLSELEENNSYLLNLTRLSSYTRSRLDYERAVTHLTQEQEKIIAEIDFGKDFLIKGTAGTGKTLVLLKALEKVRKLDRDELDLDQGAASTLLLTYTRTLVKYDRYLADIMKTGEAANSIETADKYIRDVLQLFLPQSDLDYDLPGQFSKPEHTGGLLSGKQLSEEIEDYLFANNISEEEYLVALKPRTGMSKSLTRPQRKMVWQARQAFIEHMESTNRYSKNYTRIKLLNLVEADPVKAHLLQYDFIFVDEVQDLAAVDLALLKKLAGRTIIMAGDADQAIYQPGFTFSRAGIDITGRSRILRINFRNTVQIHEAAESFRNRGGVAESNQGYTPEAFRIGPSPECFVAGETTDLVSKVLLQIKLYIETLDYDSENICLVAPSNDLLSMLEVALKEAGYRPFDLRKREFSFHRQSIIRLSTLHSSKGLDFPVVLLFLPELPFVSDRYDQTSRDKIMRNMIYVAMTRAMDHLNVFLTDQDQTDSLILDDLRESLP